MESHDLDRIRKSPDGTYFVATLFGDDSLVVIIRRQKDGNFAVRRLDRRVPLIEIDVPPERINLVWQGIQHLDQYLDIEELMRIREQEIARIRAQAEAKRMAVVA